MGLAFRPIEWCYGRRIGYIVATDLFAALLVDILLILGEQAAARILMGILTAPPQDPQHRNRRRKPGFRVTIRDTSRNGFGNTAQVPNTASARSCLGGRAFRACRVGMGRDFGARGAPGRCQGNPTPGLCAFPRLEEEPRASERNGAARVLRKRWLLRHRGRGTESVA
jgi:hypothetical protein